MITKANNKGFAPIVLGIIIAAILGLGAAGWWFFAKDEAAEDVAETGDEIIEVVECQEAGEFPPGEVETALEFCLLSDSLRGCREHPGWMIDLKVNLKEDGAESCYQEVRTGGCSGEGAGDSRPVRIEGETFDYQGKTIEYVCDAACFSWECSEESEQKAACPQGQFNDQDECLLACDGGVCQTKGDAPPYCYECKKGCDLDAWSACEAKCEPPGVCMERKCSLEDQNCRLGCINTAETCIESCLAESNCKWKDIPQELRPVEPDN